MIARTTHRSSGNACMPEGAVASIPRLMIPDTSVNTIGATAPLARFVDSVLPEGVSTVIGIRGTNYRWLNLFYLAGATQNLRVKVFGAYAIDDGSEKLPDGSAISGPVINVSGKRYVILPLFNPQTGNHEIDFSSATPEINETYSGYTHKCISANQYIAVAGADIVFALISSPSTNAGSLYGHLVS